MPADWPPVLCIDCSRHPPVGRALEPCIYRAVPAFNPRCLYCHDKLVRAAEAAGGAKVPLPGEPAYRRRIGR